MPTLSPAQLLAEIEDAILQFPNRSDEADFVAWVGRAAMLLKRWNSNRSVTVDAHARGAFMIRPGIAQTDIKSLLMLLHEARQDLRLNEVGPLSATIDRGAVLDYFEEVRKVIVTAQLEVFFVDPYLDAEFISRYMPQIPQGTSVRLLAKKGITALLPALELAAHQYNLDITLRASTTLHDRYLFIDRSRGFHSGASFKDGARLAPTIFTEIADVLQSVLGVYEEMWSTAIVHR